MAFINSVFDNYGVHAPCKNCEKREVGCHIYCEKYIAFKAEYERIKAKDKEEKNREHLFFDGISEKKKRSKKK